MELQEKKENNMKKIKESLLESTEKTCLLTLDLKAFTS